MVWESNDLVNWSEARLVEVSPENAGMTWAPDAIWDPEAEQYLVHWTTNLKGDGWYIMKSYTSDFKTFSPAEKFLTGAGMDATIARDETSNVTYRISKNGPGELIEEASAPSLEGPWTVVSQEIGSGTIPAGEGPLVFQNNEDPSKVRNSFSLPSYKPRILKCAILFITFANTNAVAHVYRRLYPSQRLHPLRNLRHRIGRMDSIGRI